MQSANLRLAKHTKSWRVSIELWCSVYESHVHGKVPCSLVRKKAKTGKLPLSIWCSLVASIISCSSMLWWPLLITMSGLCSIWEGQLASISPSLHCVGYWYQLVCSHTTICQTTFSEDASKRPYRSYSWEGVKGTWWWLVAGTSPHDQ